MSRILRQWNYEPVTAVVLEKGCGLWLEIGDMTGVALPYRADRQGTVITTENVHRELLI